MLNQVFSVFKTLAILSLMNFVLKLTDQYRRPLETEDQVNLTFLINK